MASMTYKPPCVLTIYRFDGAKAFLHERTPLDNLPVKTMLQMLASVRENLPVGYGASLTDATGREIR